MNNTIAVLTSKFAQFSSAAGDGVCGPREEALKEQSGSDEGDGNAPSTHSPQASGPTEVSQRASIQVQLDALAANIDAKISSAVHGVVSALNVPHTVREMFQGFAGKIGPEIAEAVTPGVLQRIIPDVEGKLMKVWDLVAAGEKRLEAAIELSSGPSESQMATVTELTNSLRAEFRSLSDRLDSLEKASVGLELSGRSPTTTVCKYGRACHRHDCVFAHPEGRRLDEVPPTPAPARAREVSAPVPICGSVGPSRIEPRATPINYQKFDDIAMEDEVGDYVEQVFGFFGKQGHS
ncbi:unnamed protein product [Prorocentrum cordatum]|uniref:C3H1-type domain-containing protein n=1 Tax=Prorocentrum cordatum TaxID=2364126 RepID=A0ABN9XZT8_9DINO|nr:unnamed protein product [Polarella glacialis]